jgi:hypothetical protein
MKTIEDMKLELLSDNSNKFMQTLIDYDIKSKDKYGSNLLHYYIMNYDSIVHPAGVIISEFIKKGLDINDKRKYIAKEYALAYIFDLYAKGEMIPINAIDGGYNAKQLKQVGLDKGFSSPDTFYRAVKTVLEFDLNKVKDLQSISKYWLSAVEKLSNNWIETQQYLMKQNLIEV